MIDDESTIRRIELLEQRVRELEDQRSLLELVARYSFTADTHRADDFANLFTDDGIYDYGTDFPDIGQPGFDGTMQGRDALVRLVNGPSMPPVARSQHHTTAPLVFQIDGDRATGTGYSVTYVQRQEEDGRVWNEVWNLGFNVWFFERTADGWRISKRLRREAGSGDIVSMLQ